jgi:hypothetical protein
MTQKSAAEDTSIRTGVVCTESNLYKCSNGNFEIIQFVEAGRAFPNTPFGDSRGTTSWKKVTLASDGSRTTFDGRKPSAVG